MLRSKKLGFLASRYVGSKRIRGTETMLKETDTYQGFQDVKISGMTTSGTLEIRRTESEF